MSARVAQNGVDLTDSQWKMFRNNAVYLLPGLLVPAALRRLPGARWRLVFTVVVRSHLKSTPRHPHHAQRPPRAAVTVPS